MSKPIDRQFIIDNYILAIHLKLAEDNSLYLLNTYKHKASQAFKDYLIASKRLLKLMEQDFESQTSEDIINAYHKLTAQIKEELNKAVIE